MRSRAFLFVSLLAVLAVAVSAVAQEGHPLKGTWLGDWGPNKTDRNQIIARNGLGREADQRSNQSGSHRRPLKNGDARPKRLGVHFEADGKNAAGQPVHYVMDGKIENLGLYNRAIAEPGLTTM